MTAALHHALCQFYYREARLLDERRLESWLGLLAPEILYEMPVRHNYLGDPEAAGTEAYHAPGREYGSDAEAPFRRDTLQTLAMRAKRITHPTVWFENPPPRTRRFISNVEIAEEGPELSVYSNFLLHFSHHEADNHLYAGARRDTLRQTEDSFLLVRRRVLLDWNIIPVPTLGLIF